MKPQFASLELHRTAGALTVGSGAALDVDQHVEKTVQVGGTFVGTVQIQGSLDGSNWFHVGLFQVPGRVRVRETVAYLRTRLLVLASGQPEVTYGGFDARSA